MPRKGKELSELSEDPARGPAVTQPLPARLGSWAYGNLPAGEVTLTLVLG